MSMFPGAGAQVYRNEAGEPIGWDNPAYDDFLDEDYYSDLSDYSEARDYEDDAS